ncbi:MAG TPA: valine--tRNA ligase, partial [bacterium]|nr:valine--tRNA ligase [bacterium]
VYLTPLGGDIHFDHTLVEMGQKFSNKLWNASRFVLMNLEDDQAFTDPSDLDSDTIDLADRWILSRLQATIRDVRKGFESFRFNDAARMLHGFVWGDFCDWYLELIKPRLYEKDHPQTRLAAQSVVLFVLDHILRLLHPIMPFISEEIWQALPKAAGSPDTILLAAYPAVHDRWIDDGSESEMEFVQQAVGAIRNIRGEMNVPQDRKANVILRGPESRLTILRKNAGYLRRLADVENLIVDPDAVKPQDAATALAGDVEIFVPLAGLIDLGVERGRIQKEIDRIEGFLAGLEKKLGNEQFVSKAPAEVVEKERRKQADFAEKIQKLKENLARLG